MWSVRREARDLGGLGTPGTDSTLARLARLLSRLLRMSSLSSDSFRTRLYTMPTHIPSMMSSSRMRMMMTCAAVKSRGMAEPTGPQFSSSQPPLQLRTLLHTEHHAVADSVDTLDIYCLDVLPWDIAKL